MLLRQAYREAGIRLARRRLWVWLTPILVYIVARKEQARLHTLVEALVAVGLVAVISRYPYKAITALLLFLPFELIAFSLLLRFGVPAQILRGLGFWKEAVLAGLAVAAVRSSRLRRFRLDRVDRLVVAFAVVGLAYLALPDVLLSSTAAGAHLSFYTRELGWRSSVMYVAIFLVFRHLQLAGAELETLVRRLVVSGSIIAFIGVYEFFRPFSFNNFLVNTAQVPVYKAVVLHAPVGTPTNLLTFASNGHVRIGSVFIDNLTDGWYYILLLGLIVELIIRGGRMRGWLLIALMVTGSALLFTQARASIVGGLLAVAFGLRAQVGRSLTQRVRLGVMFALVVLVAVPTVIFSGLGHRFVSSSSSNKGHTNGVIRGLHVMGANPLGRGLSTATGGGQLAAAKGLISSTSVFDPENQWLLVGTELGVFGLLVYSGSVIGIFVRLKPGRGADELPPAVQAGAAGMRNAMFGLIFGTIVAQPFLDNAISWTVFGLCGAAVGAIDRAQAPPAAISEAPGVGVTDDGIRPPHLTQFVLG